MYVQNYELFPSNPRFIRKRGKDTLEPGDIHTRFCSRKKNYKDGDGVTKAQHAGCIGLTVMHILFR
jgi:hypothetical protein